MGHSGTFGTWGSPLDGYSDVKEPAHCAAIAAQTRAAGLKTPARQIKRIVPRTIFLAAEICLVFQAFLAALGRAWR